MITIDAFLLIQIITLNSIEDLSLSNYFFINFLLERLRHLCQLVNFLFQSYWVFKLSIKWYRYLEFF